jgi:hypothetical protein
MKNYGRLKLRWSDFGFYFLSLFSILSFFSLSSLFLYMKTNENVLVIRRISVFERWIEINER